MILYQGGVVRRALVSAPRSHSLPAGEMSVLHGENPRAEIPFD